MIPGSNILNIALTAIGMQQVLYYRFLTRTTNEIGLDESNYDSPIVVSGSLQPVPRNRYEQLGLDFNQNYFTFYAAKNIQDLARDVSGDRISFNGKVFDCLSANDWYGIDGWLAITLVEITSTVEPTGNFFYTDDGLLNQYFTDDGKQNPYTFEGAFNDIIYFNDDDASLRYFTDNSFSDRYYGADST